MTKPSPEEPPSDVVQSRRNWRILVTVYLALQLLLFIATFAQNPTLVLVVMMLITVAIIALIWKQEIERIIRQN